MEAMIESLLASKDLCNLADVLKYPPSAKQPCALPRHVEATSAEVVADSSFHVAVWAEPTG